MSKPSAAAIYARISSDQDGTGLGVERQREDCRAWAERNGWPVAEEFVDNDVSAYSGKARPAYERMLAAMRGGRVDAVIVYHMDRLTRRPKELEEFVELCDSLRITSLATVAGEVKIADGDGLLVARLMAAVAANESASKSRRVRRKMEQVAQSGMPHGGANRPFGYRDDHITVDRAEARIIKQCARRVIAGESLRSVTAWLGENEVPTVNGARWRTSTVRAMLTNPRLIGMRTLRGEVVGKAVWKPILTESEQTQVIARIEQRRIAGRRAPRRYVLSGMLRCGKCGNTLFSSARVNTRRYVCLSGPDHDGCGRLTVVAAPVEELVAEMVLFRLDTPDLATALRGGDDSPESSALLEQVAADEAQMEELAAAYADRRISMAEWIPARDVIQARIASARRQMSEHVNGQALADLIGTGDALRTTWETLPLDRQSAIIGALIDKVVIGPGTPGATTLDPARVTPVWKF